MLSVAFEYQSWSFYFEDSFQADKEELGSCALIAIVIPLTCLHRPLSSAILTSRDSMSAKRSLHRFSSAKLMGLDFTQGSMAGHLSLPHEKSTTIQTAP